VRIAESANQSALERQRDLEKQVEACDRQLESIKADIARVESYDKKPIVGPEGTSLIADMEVVRGYVNEVVQGRFGEDEDNEPT
jgi:hypothetical protein